MNYIVKEMRPLITFEKPAFRGMLMGINPSIQVMCRKTLTQRLGDKFQVMKTELRSQLSEIKYVCTTADIWSVNCKSFIKSFRKSVPVFLETQKLA